MTDIQSGLICLCGAVFFTTALIIDQFKNTGLKILTGILILAVMANCMLLFAFFILRTNYQLLGALINLSLHKIPIFFMDGVIFTYFVVYVLAENDQLNLTNESPKKLITLLKLTMASYFLYAGIGKILNYQGMLGFFHASGYGAAFLNIIIVLECSCAIGLLFQITLIPATALLIADMLGATFTRYHNYFTSGTPEPFSNSIDSLKMLPFLIVIFITAINRRKSVRLRKI